MCKIHGLIENVMGGSRRGGGLDPSPLENHRWLSVSLEILVQTPLGEAIGPFASLDPLGEQWLRGRVLDSRLKGRRFEPHLPHCVVSLSKNINPSLVLVQPRKTGPFITERLLMGCKESNQTKNLWTL